MMNRYAIIIDWKQYWESWSFKIVNNDYFTVLIKLNDYNKNFIIGALNIYMDKIG